MNSTAGENLWNLVETGEDSDCLIIVNDGKHPVEEFKVYRMILKKCSPVLRAMLQSGMKEDKTGIIEINDFPPTVIKRVLRNIYCCKLDKDLSLLELIDLLIAADKYQIETLIEECTEYVIDKFLDVEICSVLLSNIHLFSSTLKLKKLCFNILKENTQHLFRDKRLLKISEDLLADILKLEEFNLDSELDLIDFAARWALEKIENTEQQIAPFKNTPMRNILENKVFPNLRFLTLSVQEIATQLCISVLLTSEERGIIETAIKDGKINENFPKYLSTSTIKRSFFETTENDLTFRHGKTRNLITVNLGESILLNKCLQNLYECSFTVQCSNFKLFGIQLYPPVKICGCNIILSLSSRYKSVFTEIMQHKNNEINTYYFKTPTTVDKNCSYKLTLSTESDNSIEFYCLKKSTSVVKMQDDIALIYVSCDVGPIRSLIFLEPP